MKNKVLKISIAIVLIMTLTMANFIFLALNVVSYAVDGIVTNHKNVEFETYFKDENGKKVGTFERIAGDEEESLYISINVKKEGYFNGAIELKNAEIDFINTKSEYVNKLEGNKMYLNQINAGTSAEIEVKIKEKAQERYNIAEDKNLIELQGKYRDRTEKDIKIEAQRKVRINLIERNDETNVENEMKIITNKIAKILGEEKRIIQVSIDLGLKENNYPIKEIRNKINVPKINGEKPEIIQEVKLNNMTGYEVKEGEGELEFILKNEEKDNRITWKKEGKENIILTYIYKAEAKIEKEKLKIEEEVTLQNDKKIKVESKEIEIPEEEIDTTIEISVNNKENEIYKGKLNSGIEREIGSETKLTVNLANMAEYVLIKEKESEYKTEEGNKRANVIYKRTIISKEEFKKIFGEEGEIQIYNEIGEEIGKINRESKEDENGNIIIDYIDKEIRGIEIKTTKPIAEGSIRFNHEKIIKEERETVKEAKALRTDISYEYNIYKEETKLAEFTQGEEKEISTKIELKDSTTEATIELDKEKLSTVISNDIEMKIVLKTNEEKYDLNKDPIIEIRLPEEVENININSIKLLYEDELKVKRYNVEGRKIIIELEGEQSQYKENTIEGTNIIINATIEVNRKSIAKEEEIIMNYKNDKATKYEEGKEIGEKTAEIEIVTPKDVTTINSIRNLGVETVGEEEEKEVELERGKNKKKVEVGFEVINNNPENIENVNVLGTFPTKTGENNIDIEVLDKIEIENGKVYYSENENATEELGKEENKWKEEIQDKEKVKKYLIVLENIEAQNSVEGSYKIEIPENLEYNQQAKVGYETTYTNAVTKGENKVKATTITMQTGKGPQLETTIGATIGGEEIKETTVKNGEVIKYEVKVSNTGSEKVENIEITGKVPEGTKLVEPIEEYEYTAETYYKELDVKEYKGKIESLEVGETKTLEYEVRTNINLKAGTEIKNEIETKYLDVKQKSNELKYISEESNIRVTVKRVTDRNQELYENGGVEYYAIVENISEKKQKDIKLKTKLSGNAQIEDTEIIELNSEESGNKEISEEKKNKSDEINLGTFEPGQIKIFKYYTKINRPTDDKTDIITFSVNAIDSEKEYRSNQWQDKIKRFDISMGMQTNTESQYVNSADTIEYLIKIVNNSKSEVLGLSIKDIIPSQLTITKIEKGQEEVKLQDGNNLTFIENLPIGGELNIKITTLVDYSDSRDNAESITNQAIASLNGTEIAKTQEITHIIRANEKDPDEGGDSNQDGNTGENNENDNNLDDNNIATGTRNITGKAWFDSNGNGRKDPEEKVLNNIKVKLLNVDTNKIVKDKDGKVLEAITNDNGIYILSNIGNGNYIAIYEYNNTQYGLTKYKVEGIAENENSDVRINEIILENQKQKVASTDILKIEDIDISNIDIGLIELKDFDLKLDKTISKMIIQNAKGTTAKEYNDVKTAKSEIDAKQLNGTTVLIEYKIKVSNVGEVAGYAKKIVDYIPGDLQFSSELNKDWYQTGNVLISASLANDKIEPGESRTLTLTLTKRMNEENTGLVNNRAEITEDYNDLGLVDINSVPGNQSKDENDYSTADVILSIRTGVAVYVSIGVIVAIIVISGITSAIIVKRKNSKEK